MVAIAISKRLIENFESDNSGVVAVLRLFKPRMRIALYRPS